MTSNCEKDFAAFLNELNGLTCRSPFCDLVTGLADAVRREIGCTEEGAAIRLMNLGLPRPEAQALATRLMAGLSCAVRCQALLKDWLSHRKAMHELVRVKEKLADLAASEKPAKAAAAHAVEDVLAAMASALDAVWFAKDMPNLTSREMLHRGYADFLLSRGAEPSADAADRWIADAEKYVKRAEEEGDRPRRYIREFVAPLSMEERKAVADAMCIGFNLSFNLLEKPALSKRAFLLADRTGTEAVLEEGAELLQSLYFAMSEVLLLNVWFFKPPVRKRDQTLAGSLLARRIMAAADAVRCDARDQAEDAFHAMGLIVELLAVLKPREVKQLTDELPEKYHPLVAQSVQALWEVAVWLDEQRNPNRQTPLSE